MPLIHRQFGLEDTVHMPGKFVLLRQETEENHDMEKELVRDHHLFQVLQMLEKLCGFCPSFLKQTEEIEKLATHVQTLLAHPHEWVRLSAAEFLGFVLSSMDVDHLVELLLENRSDEVGYLCSNPTEAIRSLTLDLCGQLQPEGAKAALAQQVIKNLVFIARVLQKIPLDSSKGDGTINEEKRLTYFGWSDVCEE